MRTIRRIDHDPHRRAVCRRCHQTIVSVEGVGWLDPDAGDTYDICPQDPYGNHEPLP